MSVLVAGTTGAIVHHVLELLPREKGPLVAAGLRLPPPRLQRSDVQYVRADLRDPEEARRLFEYHQPSDVIHLAGRWSVRSGELEPEEALLGNVSLARNVLEACRRSCPGARILFQSSAEIYGRGPVGRGAEIPRTEDDPALPLSTTGASLACGEILTRQYALSHGLRVVVARPFNVVGPYLSRQFLAGELAWQLSRVQVDRGEPVLYAGDLEVERDYVDVRDLARAYLLLLEKGEPGESYNVATGRAVPARQVADDLIQLAGGGIEIRFDPRRERNAEIPMIVGSIDKIRNRTGWSPAIPLRESLRDLWTEKLERARLERKGTPC
jgi:GDP-4-dehydro-6-deoxy-D-mannose reductase